MGTSFPLARILLVAEPDANDASDLPVDGDGSEAYEDDEVKDSKRYQKGCATCHCDNKSTGLIHPYGKSTIHIQ